MALMIIAWINLGLKTPFNECNEWCPNLDTLLTGSYSFRILL